MVRVGIFGIGVRHSISQYLPVLPVDIAVQVVWQQVLVKDALDAELMDLRTFCNEYSG